MDEQMAGVSTPAFIITTISFEYLRLTLGKNEF